MLKELGDIGIHFFRHGESFYKQDRVPLADANDLTENGVDRVKRSSEILSALIKDRGPCLSVIASSPLGRTLQTAKLITEVFDNQGIPLRRKLDSSFRGILIIPQLKDQVGYDFFVDQSEVNPQMESLGNVQKRMLRVIERLLAAQSVGKFSDLILVSHDASTGFLVRKFTTGKRSNLQPGEFISMVKSNDNLSIQIGDIEGVYSFNTDFLSFFSTQP